ncbi:hypothetical protein PBY51_000713 [Eleginops maclovinus]|uniref:Uncharacterized protein n=1 Tax=Eleginops maclovinus TaxID=56733 RepID=A0AAN7XMG6_ELEMC|nr:hypothetical protein PBY51_000713 [Eleginops maclovinus]
MRQVLTVRQHRGPTCCLRGAGGGRGVMQSPPTSSLCEVHGYTIFIRKKGIRVSIYNDCDNPALVLKKDLESDDVDM